MNRFEQRVVLCHLVDAMHQHGSWVGETHIQKCSMFLQKMLGVPIDYHFILYKHGPYSFDLRSELAEMRVRFLIDVEPHPRYAPSYVLGTRGEGSVNLPNKYSKEINFVSEEVSPKDIRELERVSTVYFIQQENRGLTPSQVARRVCELKPHIQPHQAASAVQEVQHIIQAAAEQGLLATPTNEDS